MLSVQTHVLLKCVLFEHLTQDLQTFLKMCNIKCVVKLSIITYIQWH